MRMQNDMGEWTLRATRLDAHTLRVELLRCDLPLPRGEFARALSDDARVRALLTESLRDAPFPAYFWELVPLSQEREDAPFEYVVCDSPSLARVVADSSPFAARLSEGTASVVSFANLGGDARLVVPRSMTSAAAYRHLAAFVREGPTTQVDDLWVKVGQAIESWRLSRSETVWVNTSGLGVHWLHVRLDTRPKYYSHQPYCDPNA